MDELIKPLIEWMLTNYKNIFIFISIIIFILYIFKQIKEIFSDPDSNGVSFGEKIKKFLNIKNKNEKKNEPSHVQYTDDERKKIIKKLQMHNFFVLSCNLKNNLNNVDFGNFKKNQILRDIIKIYIDTIEKHTKDFIKNNKLDLMDTYEINELLKKEIELIDYDIYIKYKNRLGDDLYNLIIDHPEKGFKTRNSTFREIFINGIISISSQSLSVYDYDNYERASEILTSMYISLNVIVKNFEKVFKDFNGELDKYL